VGLAAWARTATVAPRRREGAVAAVAVEAEAERRGRGVREAGERDGRHDDGLGPATSLSPQRPRDRSGIPFRPRRIFPASSRTGRQREHGSHGTAVGMRRKHQCRNGTSADDAVVPGGSARTKPRASGHDADLLRRNLVEYAAPFRKSSAAERKRRSGARRDPTVLTERCHRRCLLSLNF